MARPPKFTEEQILDATLALVAAGGPGAATIGAIAEASGAPVGSLYHRFRSRDLILARLWVRTIDRFQQGFLAALSDDDLDTAAVGAALHAVRWSRDHLDEAKLLVLFRRRDLAERWPEELGDELAGLNAQVEAALREHARRRYGREDEKGRRRVIFALVDLPYAAGRRSLGAGVPPPPWMDEMVVQACHCILAGADVDIPQAARGPEGEETG